jgi:hypothetical protein
MVSSEWREERRAVSGFAISRAGMFIRRSSSVRRGMRVATSLKIRHRFHLGLLTI